jgi:phosphohistidine phosphatase SixA
MGRDQIEKLARKMAVSFAGLKVVILTSHQFRTLETTKIIGEALGSPQSEVNTCLSSWEGDLPLAQKRKILEIVNEYADKFDVVILVTHMEVIDLFPTFWGLSKGFVIREMMDAPKGSARVIDTVRGVEEMLLRP